MNRITKTTAIAAVAAFCIIGTASAASAASGEIPWNGNGFTAGVLNTDNPTGETDSAQDGYLFWVLNAKGITNPVLHIGAGAFPFTAGNGKNNHKVETDYFKATDLTGAFVTYDGTLSGNATLTVSHGHPVDTKIPEATFDPKTGSGVLVKDETTGEAPTFDLTWTVVADNYWEAWDGLDDGDGDIYRHRSARTVYDVVPDVTKIVGDQTGQVLGWNVTPRLGDANGNYDATMTSIQFSGDPFWYHVTAPFGNYASNDGGTFVLTVTNPDLVVEAPSA